MSADNGFTPEEEAKLEQIVAFITDTPDVAKATVRAKLHGEEIFILGAVRHDDDGDFIPLCILMDMDLAQRIELPEGFTREGKEVKT